MSNESSGNGLDLTLRDFASGQKLFGRYTLIKTLGRGGMGIVWLGRDEELERNVALKFLPELIIHDRAVLGDLKRETRRSLDLTHKNIVRIYDFVQDTQSACISMEYVDGDTLSNLRADKPDKIFEPDELMEWVSQLCDALDYAHNHARIVHRDLKPANLMVNQRGDLKVADFGIARSLSDSVSKLTMQMGKSGTLVYMSPQQLDGERGNHLDDVYSLGASIYELLTSKPPFYSGNVDRQIREKIPPSMTQRRKDLEIEGNAIDAVWEEVVQACLAKNPERRPQSVSEIAKRLAVPSPKTRRAQLAAVTTLPNKRVGLFVGLGLLIGLAAISGWHFGFFHISQRLPTAVTARPSVPERSASIKPSVAPEKPAAITAALPEPAASFPAAAPNQTIGQTAPPVATNQTKAEPSPIGPGPQITDKAVYQGTIHVKNDGSVNVPLRITMGPDLKSGTMTQSGHRGDAMVKFTGVWDKGTLHAVTNEVVSTPKGINWEPESFTLHFADDGKTATYECVADGKNYTADLAAPKPQTAAGVLYAPQPAYPAKARKSRAAGSGRFKITFDERGLAKSVETIESTGNQILDSGASKTLKEWRAVPGTREIIVPVTFEIP